ncbi:MAG: hypothetical protein HY223_10185 [Thaumarchaeota archaeon]|nr:hypothetical protein [Nitrososphaerota archaeon]
MKKQIAYKVKDCEEGGQAELVLLVDNMYPKKPVRVCSKCLRSTCLSSCKAEAYEERINYYFDALDDSGLINLRIPYWSDIDGSMIQPMNIFKVTGEIRKKYNGKFDFIAKKIEKVKKLITA